MSIYLVSSVDKSTVQISVYFIYLRFIYSGHDFVTSTPVFQ